jgi:hypothetical protein
MNGIREIRLLHYLMYLLLLPVFFVLHGLNAFWLLLPVRVLFGLLVSYISIAAITGVLAYLLFKEGVKAFIFAFYILLVFFFFGSIHDWLKASIGENRISSYSFLLSFLGILSLLLFYILKKHYQSARRMFQYCRVLLLVLVGVEVAVSIFNIISGKAAGSSILYNAPDLGHQPVDPAMKPDIFFIVFDEYANSKSLKQDFSFDNLELDSSFVSRGFFYPQDSKSNYGYTRLSLPSVLALNYLKIDDRAMMDLQLEMRGEKAIEKSPLPGFLQAEGYTLFNYGCFDFANAKVKGPAYMTSDKLRSVIDNQTIVSRIKRDIWWNVAALFSDRLQLSGISKKERELHVTRNMYNYTGFVQQLKMPSGRPRFVFAHLMLPHDPFFLDSTGHYIPDSCLLLNKFTTRELYLMQVKYANHLIKNILGLTVQKAGRPRVIIIQGDHGYRFYTDAKLDAAFENLNAYYFSDGDYSRLYNGISPVNAFRVVLNKYFGCSLPLLKDSSVRIRHPRIRN